MIEVRIQLRDLLAASSAEAAQALVHEALQKAGVPISKHGQPEREILIQREEPHTQEYVFLWKDRA